MTMKDKAANDEANVDASGTSNSQELGLDGDNDREYTTFFRQQPRSPNQDDVHTHAREDGTPDPPVSPLPLPTRKVEMTNNDDAPVQASQMAVAFEEMDEGNAMEPPTAASAPSSSTGLGLAPPPVPPASAREGIEALHDEDKGPAPADRSPLLLHAGIEISDRDAPVPDEMPPVQAAHTALANEARTAPAYEQMEHELSNLPSPTPLMPAVPGFQIAAAYEDEMEQNVKSSTIDAPPPSIPPMPDALMAAIFEDEGERQMAYEKKKTMEEGDFQQSRDPPTPAVPRATSPTPRGFENKDAAALQRKRERVRHQQEEILQQAQDPPTPAKASLKHKRKRVQRQQEQILRKAHGSHTPAEEDAQHPSTNPAVRAQSLPAITTQVGADATPLGRTQSVTMLPMRPPPRSMLPPSDDDPPPATPTARDPPVRPPPQSMLSSPDEDTATPSVPSPAPPGEPSTPMLTATPIESGAMMVSDLPVYDAVQVKAPTRLEKNKKIVIGLGMGLLIGAGLAAGLLVGSNNDSNGSNTVDSSQGIDFPEGVVFSTFRPSESESSSPSEVPSFRPTLRPSRSLIPSINPSESVKPSVKPSLLPSAPPSTYWSSLHWSRQDAGFNGESNSNNGPFSGQTTVFAWDEATLNFEQIGQSLYGNVARDSFGSFVQLSSEGKTLAVGAHQKGTTKAGYVDVYGWDKTTEEYKRLGKSLGGKASDDSFGEALALAGNCMVLAVGAPGNDRNGTNVGRGQVELFEIEL